MVHFSVYRLFLSLDGVLSFYILIHELCQGRLQSHTILTTQYVALLLFISAGIVRASSVFPILSTCLLMLGGLCVGVGRVYNKTNNVLLSAGILFVAAGESAIHPPRSNRVTAGVSK